MPNHKILNGIHAKGGIGLKKFTTGSKDHAKLLEAPSREPNGIATKRATPMAIKTLERLA